MPSFPLRGPKPGWENGINVDVVGWGGDIKRMYVAQGGDE